MRCNSDQRERWGPNPERLSFPWAARLPGEPIKVALLAARWAAYDTMELARRLEMDVEHQYFDGKGELVQPNAWPYRNQTGVGPLSAGLAARNVRRICADTSRDLILVADVSPGAIPARAMDAIVAPIFLQYLTENVNAAMAGQRLGRVRPDPVVHAGRVISGPGSQRRSSRGRTFETA